MCIYWNGVLFLFAITQNIGMTIGLMPITGITLPLVSYGGSSLLTTILSLGIVLNIGMSKRKYIFSYSKIAMENIHGYFLCIDKYLRSIHSL